MSTLAQLGLGDDKIVITVSEDEAAARAFVHIHREVSNVLVCSAHCCLQNIGAVGVVDSHGKLVGNISAGDIRIGTQ